MARFGKKTISRRTVEALKVEKDTIFWDSEPAGFGVHVHPTGRKVYIVQTRAGGKAAKRVTVGRHGVVTPEEARRRTALIVARIKAGEDPVPEPLAAKLAGGPTVGELAELYLKKHVAVRCKPKTESMYRLIVAKHILPAFGKSSALAVGHRELTEFHHALSARPVMANQAVDALSRIYNAAEDRSDIPEASNPCRQVVKDRERRRERFLTDEEFRRLGRVLDEAETCKGVSVHAVAAKRIPIVADALSDDDFKPRFEQKGVDMRLGLDIASYAADRSVDRIILVTGDTDCLPVMKRARTAGLKVVLAQFPKQRLARELLWHSDFRRPVEWPSPEVRPD